MMSLYRLASYHLQTCSALNIFWKNFSMQSGTDFTKLSTRKYWEKIYSDETFRQEPFDWFIESGDVINKLESLLETKKNQTLTILDIGCGISSFPEKLYSYTKHPLDIHCIDFIMSVVIQQQYWLSKASKGHGLTSSHFVVADACSLPYRNCLFDLVIDKGTMDALIKDKNTGFTRCRQMISELGRLLKHNGTIIQISDEDPEIRQPLLEQISTSNNNSIMWSSVLLTSFGSIEYFMYNGVVKKFS